MLLHLFLCETIRVERIPTSLLTSTCSVFYSLSGSGIWCLRLGSKWILINRFELNNLLKTTRKACSWHLLGLSPEAEQRAHSTLNL